jgi:hypothetical protein
MLRVALLEVVAEELAALGSLLDAEALAAAIHTDSLAAIVAPALV